MSPEIIFIKLEQADLEGRMLEMAAILSLGGDWDSYAGALTR